MNIILKPTSTRRSISFSDMHGVATILQFTLQTINHLTIDDTHRLCESQQNQIKKEIKEASSNLLEIKSTLNKNNLDDAELYKHIDLLLQILSMLYDRINTFANQNNANILTKTSNSDDKNTFNNAMVTIGKIINENIKFKVTNEQNKYNNKTLNNKRLTQKIIGLIESLAVFVPQPIIAKQNTAKGMKLITSSITKIEHIQRITTKVV